MDAIVCKGPHSASRSFDWRYSVRHARDAFASCALNPTFILRKEVDVVYAAVHLRLLNVTSHCHCRRRRPSWQLLWRRLMRIPMKSEITDHHLVVGPVQVAPIASVRNLGALVYLDSVMMMKTHVTQLVSSCFGILRQIRSIRPSLPRSTLTMLISSFIMSKLDYTATWHWSV